MGRACCDSESRPDLPLTLRSRLDHPRTLIGEGEDTIGFEEEVARAIGGVERHELLAAPNVKAQRRQIRLIHPGVHREDKPLTMGFQPAINSFERLQRPVRIIAQEQLEPLLPDVHATHRHALARHDGIAELNGRGAVTERCGRDTEQKQQVGFQNVGRALGRNEKIATTNGHARVIYWH